MARLPGLIAFLKMHAENIQDHAIDATAYTDTLSDLHCMLLNSAENRNDDTYEEFEIAKYPTEEIFDRALSKVPGMTRSKDQKERVTYTIHPPTFHAHVLKLQSVPTHKNPRKTKMQQPPSQSDAHQIATKKMKSDFIHEHFFSKTVAATKTPAQTASAIVSPPSCPVIMSTSVAQHSERELESARITRAVTEFSSASSSNKIRLLPGLHTLLSGVFPDLPTRLEYIQQLTSSTDPQSETVGLKNAGVYVLKLHGLPYQFYVGSSKNISARVDQHRKGTGAVCTQDATRIEYVSRIPCPSPKELDDMERKETLDRMYKNGINQVRGWKFSTKVLSEAHKQQAFEDICCRFDLCLKCGETKHFVGECRSQMKAKWCGGAPV